MQVLAYLCTAYLFRVNEYIRNTTVFNIFGLLETLLREVRLKNGSAYCSFIQGEKSIVTVFLHSL